MSGDYIHVGNVIIMENNYANVNSGGSITFTQQRQTTSNVAAAASIASNSTVEHYSWWNQNIGDGLSQTFVGSLFNTVFGSNKTHILNNSDFTIIVILGSEEFRIVGLEFSKEEISALNDNKMVRQVAFLKSHKNVRFERNHRIDSLTVLVPLPNGNYRPTATIHIYANMSYRVNGDGIPERTMYDA
ncbi:hypothetical protein Bhyg_07247 [Pseudolycoriella hygida]|uniref:Uncharacterized protein n=1 Tax=Pseudolycoriella hygida TaxID=35572 RepID=A0A9Q0S3S5_9DIPT|nr:hypothetical protein Bhyg_07247 [Pseudolycoriella hygida]